MNLNTTKLALTIPIVLLLGVGALATSKVYAWDEGVCPWKYGPGSWDNGFNSDQQQAIYDHESNVAYSPFPLSCQSDVYSNGYHAGYSQQWSTYNQQEQQR